MLATTILDDDDNVRLKAPSDGVSIYGSYTSVVYSLKNGGLEPGRITVEMNDAV
jgi:hypothetical protein